MTYIKKILFISLLYCTIGFTIEAVSRYYYSNRCFDANVIHKNYYAKSIIAGSNECTKDLALIYESASYYSKGITNPYGIISWLSYGEIRYLEIANEKLSTILNMPEAPLKESYSYTTSEKRNTGQLVKIDNYTSREENIEIFNNYWRPIIEDKAVLTNIPPMQEDPYGHNIKILLYLSIMALSLRKIYD